MKELYYENQGTNTYLVYEIAPQDQIDSMSLGMLTNNKIPGLASTIFTQMDVKKFIKFNVSGKVSVSQFFSGAVNKKRLLGVFRGIVNAMLSAEDYMLEPSSILLDMDYIFTNVSTCETDLICLPIVKDDREKPDLGIFFRNIMFSTQFDQTENCDHVAKIINYLNGTPIFSLPDFKRLLEEIEGQKSQAVPKTDMQQQPAAPAAQSVKQKPPVIEQRASVQNQSKAPTLVTSQNGREVANSQKQLEKPLTAPAPAIPKQTEKEISFFYLMQHYNKENAAAYKAQKEAKKKENTSAKEKKTSKQDSAKKKSQPVSLAQNNFGFAVPGQAAPIQSKQTALPAQQSAQAQDIQISPQVPELPVQQFPYVSYEALQGQPMNFGETTVLGGGAIGETTVLTTEQAADRTFSPHFIRKKNQERVFLNKPVFRIGKEKSYVDYCVEDNPAISRSHANFIIRGGECFIVDTNSMNHTYINGIMIPSNEERKICHGDMIKLANEEFEFRMYE